MALIEYLEPLEDDETQYSELPSMEGEIRIKVEDLHPFVGPFVPSTVTFDEDDDSMDVEDEDDDMETAGITLRDSVSSDVPTFEEERRIHLEEPHPSESCYWNGTTDEDDDSEDSFDDAKIEADTEEEEESDVDDDVGTGGNIRKVEVVSMDVTVGNDSPSNFIGYEKMIKLQQSLSTGSHPHPHMHSINLHRGVTLTNVCEVAYLSNGFKFMGIPATKNRFNYAIIDVKKLIVGDELKFFEETEGRNRTWYHETYLPSYKGQHVAWNQDEEGNFHFYPSTELVWTKLLYHVSFLDKYLAYCDGTAVVIGEHHHLFEDMQWSFFKHIRSPLHVLGFTFSDLEDETDSDNP